jgi:hypothetical protein
MKSKGLQEFSLTGGSGAEHRHLCRRQRSSWRRQSDSDVDILIEPGDPDTKWVTDQTFMTSKQLNLRYLIHLNSS